MQVVYANAQSGDDSLTQLFDSDVDDNARAHIESRGQPQAQHARKTVLGLLGRGLEFGKSFSVPALLSWTGKSAVRPAVGSGTVTQELPASENAAPPAGSLAGLQPTTPLRRARTIRFGIINSLNKWSSLSSRWGASDTQVAPAESGSGRQDATPRTLCASATHSEASSASSNSACSPSGDTHLVGVRFVPDAAGVGIAEAQVSASPLQDNNEACGPVSEAASTTASSGPQDAAGSMLQPHRLKGADVGSIGGASGYASSTASGSHCEGSSVKHETSPHQALPPLKLSSELASLELKVRLPALRHVRSGDPSPAAALPSIKS